MGRRHLILLVALALAAVLAAAASAAITWSEDQRGTATGKVGAPLGYVAYARGDGVKFAAYVPAAKRRLIDVDFKHKAVLAVIGQFGCQDTRIAVKSIVQNGSTLAVTLAKFPLGKGQFECQAIFPTFRLLTIGRAELTRPYPTRVTVTVARA